MDNYVLNSIKEYAAQKINLAYGYCAVMDGEDLAILKSEDINGKTIKIKIESVKEI